MARVNVEDSLYTDYRFVELIVKMGGIDFALGTVVRAWSVSQKYWLINRVGIPLEIWKAQKLRPELIEVGLAEIRGDFVYIRGSEKQFSWLDACSEKGKKGGPAAAKVRIENKEKSNRPGSSEIVRDRPDTTSSLLSPSSSLSSQSHNSNSEEKIAQGSKSPDAIQKVSPTALVWKSYRDAYEKRHGSPPPWNAKIAGQLKQFVSRVPSHDAPAIAAFYLTHNSARYVMALHPVGMLLMDAEKLHTEWVTGMRMTAQKAKNAETTDYHTDQLRRIASGEL